MLESFANLGIVSLLPALISVILAFRYKNAYLALGIGVYSGIILLNLREGDGLFGALFTSILEFPNFIIGSLGDGWNAGIIVQILLIGGLVYVITYTGGLRALADSLTKWASSRKSAQFITWIMGLIIFFDDYANALIVGPSMRTITDKQKISREKLSFIIDATAAPIAGLAFISTWIGYELSLIANELESLDISSVTPMEIFINSLPYRFYNILILIFIVLTIFLGREFSKMLTAEKRAQTGEVRRIESAHEEMPEEESAYKEKGYIAKAYEGYIPILVLIISSLVLFYTNGYNAFLSTNISELVLQAEGVDAEDSMITTEIHNTGFDILLATGDLRYTTSDENAATLQETNLYTSILNSPEFSSILTEDTVDILNQDGMIQGTVSLGTTQELLSAIEKSSYFDTLDEDSQELITETNEIIEHPLGYTAIYQGFSNADASVVLAQAAFLSIIVAFIISSIRGAFKMKKGFTLLYKGMETLFPTTIILLFAWSIGTIMSPDGLGAGDYLAGALSDTIPSSVIPVIIFILGAIIAFATGTSYGTMGILFPLAIPLAWAVNPGDISFLTISVGAILTGVIVGDHCSPISDTTILSSAGADVNHIDHVQTQLPYALVIAVISAVGYLLAGFGLSAYIILPLGIIATVALLLIVGKKVIPTTV